MKKFISQVSVAIFLTTFFPILSLDAARSKKKPFSMVEQPDLRKNQKTDGSNDWTLGPTGARGWIWMQKISQGSSKNARQILITKVEKGSPADGKLKKGDVILGIDGKDFTYDVRKAFANAITEAEKTENRGRLSLKVWSEGRVAEKVLKLKTMGTFSQSSPVDCEKTEAIIDMACDYLKDKELDGLTGYITALGIIATGRQDMLPKVREFAHKICIPNEVLDLNYHKSLVSWRWSYKCLFLAEYYLLTGDEFVLPTVKEYATKIAMGQSGVGTWGHAMATREFTGKLHGYLGGYGAINQTGLTCLMAIALAEKCGIKNDEITQALKKGDIFFSYYIDKGSVPYGDHAPRVEDFDDNGKSAAAAVMFDLIGNQKGAEFFSAMTVAHSPGGREDGHTGNFWSHLWGGVGAARSGIEGQTAFFNEMRWYFELERGWKGNSLWQANPGAVSGMANKGWDCTGARLLQLSLPRKKLYITGKEMKVPNPLIASALDETIEAGRLIGYPEKLEKLEKAKIMQLLAHPLPAARSFAAQALFIQNINCVDELIKMLDSDNKYARYGACQALKIVGFKSKKAVKRLAEIMLESGDLSLRLNAIDALISKNLKTGLAEVAKPAIPAMLKLAVTQSEDDPRRLLQRKLGIALFYKGTSSNTVGLIKLHGLDGIKQSLLIPAIKELLTVDDGRSRSTTSLVYSMLSESDLKLLWNDIYLSVRDIAPSGIMFADKVRINGLKLLQENNFKEGVELAIEILKVRRWGAKRRLSAILPILGEYGGSAKAALPILEEIKKRGMKPYESAKSKPLADTKLLDETIEKIKKGKPHPLDTIVSRDD